LCGTKRYELYHNARYRAKRDRVPFDIRPEDIPLVPKFCPLLGIPITQNNKKCGPNSPTLDRILPLLGYTKENIWIISHRANTVKSDASVDELIILAKNLANRRIQELDVAINKKKEEAA
jgi:hypothetical protein